MMQNVAWKAKNTRCGIVAARSLGSNPTPLSRTWSKPPTILAVPSNAIE